MRTRDAVSDEVYAAQLALAAGGDCCPRPPFTPEREGWFGYPLSLYFDPKRHYIRKPSPGRIRRYQAGALARLIWESLPDEQRWWLHGRRPPL